MVEAKGESQARIVALRLIKTEKAPKKDRSGLRVSTDDQRRYQEIWAGLREVADEYRPNGIGLETYDAYMRQSAASAKCSVVFGLAIGFGHSSGLVIHPFRPMDLKARIAHCKSASKEDVEKALYGQIEGLESLLPDYPKGQHEHLADAAGHALMALQDMRELRKRMGC